MESKIDECEATFTRCARARFLSTIRARHFCEQTSFLRIHTTPELGYSGCVRVYSLGPVLEL